MERREAGGALTEPDYTPIFEGPDPYVVAAGDLLEFTLTTLKCVDLGASVGVKLLNWESLASPLTDIPLTNITICIPGGAGAQGTGQVQTQMNQSGQALLLIARGTGAAGPVYRTRVVKVT